MRSRRTLTATSALALTAAVVASGAIALAPSASAKGLEFRASGTCSAGATWTLKAKQQNRSIEVELQVDSNRVGQTWAAGLTDNNVRVWSGTAVTTAPSGSFTVHRVIANRAGVDVVRATAARAGQVCRGAVVYRG